MSSTIETKAMAAVSQVRHWIGGKSWEGPVERWGAVINPATGDQPARVAFATAEVVDAAVQAATKAPPTWREASLATRTRVLFAFRQLVEKHKQEIAAILTREHGKVAADALGEVNRGLEVVEFACGLPQLVKGEFSENVSTDVDSYSIRQPLGVVAGITPFNFPAMVPMWMYPIAIACGNTFILKPSEKDPSAANFSRAAPRRGRPARGRVQRRPRRQGRGRRDPQPSRHRGGELRRLDADRAVHLRDRHAERQARAGPGRREEPHGRAARRRHGARRRLRGQRGLRLGRRALHGDLGARDGGRRGRPAAAEDPGAHPQAQGRAGARAGRRDGPARHQGPPRQGGLLRREGRGRGGEAPRRRPHDPRSPATRRASSSARACSTT